MRTSGVGRIETLMFIAPGVLLVGFLLWTSGGQEDLLRWLDRTLLHTARVILDLGARVAAAVAS